MSGTPSPESQALDDLRCRPIPALPPREAVIVALADLEQAIYRCSGRKQQLPNDVHTAAAVLRASLNGGTR